MSKKRRRPLLQDEGPVSSAPHGSGAEARSDLYDAWKGQVRILDDQPAPAPEDSTEDMMAQLRVVADELSKPAQRFAAPKLLSSTDRDERSSAEAASPADAKPSASQSIDAAVVQRSIDSVASRLEALLAQSHEQLAARMTQAIAAAGDRNGLVHTSVVHDVQSRLDAVQHQLEQTTAQLEEARAEIERARSQQNDTVARLVERTTQFARVEEERDASRDAEWEGALQRAIGMLSVLESLDDVIVTLRLKPDRRSVARLQHFEREARKMAALVELEEIPVVGCVDPDQHEIVSTVGGKARTGTIVEVRQRGYMFRGRILRRAQVVVSARD